MSQRLPELIEPVRMAETQRILTGDIPIAKMKRLSSLLTDNVGDVAIELAFAVDETGQANVKGRVETRLTMQCQRCMQPMELEIAADVSLAIVGPEYPTEQLPSYYEPLVMNEETVLLSELVEDELLLALPSVPLHELEQCPARDSLTTQASDSTSSDEEQDRQKPNPFAILEQLRKKD